MSKDLTLQEIIENTNLIGSVMVINQFNAETVQHFARRFKLVNDQANEVVIFCTKEFKSAVEEFLSPENYDLKDAYYGVFKSENPEFILQHFSLSFFTAGINFFLIDKHGISDSLAISSTENGTNPEKYFVIRMDKKTEK